MAEHPQATPSFNNENVMTPIHQHIPWAHEPIAIALSCRLSLCLAPRMLNCL